MKIAEYPVFVVIDLYLITGERLFVKKKILARKGPVHLVIVMGRHMGHYRDI